MTGVMRIEMQHYTDACCLNTHINCLYASSKDVSIVINFIISFCIFVLFKVSIYNWMLLTGMFLLFILTAVNRSSPPYSLIIVLSPLPRIAIHQTAALTCVNSSYMHEHRHTCAWKWARCHCWNLKYKSDSLHLMQQLKGLFPKQYNVSFNFVG